MQKPLNQINSSLKCEKGVNFSQAGPVRWHDECNWDLQKICQRALKTVEFSPGKEVGRNRWHFAVGEQRRLRTHLFFGWPLTAADSRLINHKSINNVLFAAIFPRHPSFTNQRVIFPVLRTEQYNITIRRNTIPLNRSPLPKGWARTEPKIDGRPVGKHSPLSRQCDDWHHYLDELCVLKSNIDCHIWFWLPLLHCLVLIHLWRCLFLLYHPPSSSGTESWKPWLSLFITLFSNSSLVLTTKRFKKIQPNQQHGNQSVSTNRIW